MEFKNLLKEDRAVSPVIGVILMVAITVILAAVIGTFVLGLGNNVSTTPQAQFGFDVTDGNKVVDITHESGDTIDAADLSISATKKFGYGNGTALPSGNDTSATWKLISGDSEASAGSSASIGADSGDLGGETVRVIYDNPDSDKTATLAKKEISS